MNFLPFPAWQKALQGQKGHAKRKTIVVLYLSNLLKKILLNTRQLKENKKRL